MRIPSALSLLTLTACAEPSFEDFAKDVEFEACVKDMSEHVRRTGLLPKTDRDELAQVLCNPEEDRFISERIYLDKDADGFSSKVDCDEGDRRINPGAADRCDNIDNDCDGMVDNDPEHQVTYYPDEDGDGFGDTSKALQSCERPTDPLLKMVSKGGDCDDTRADVNSGANEVGMYGDVFYGHDGIDNDCDGTLDQDYTIPKAPEGLPEIRVFPYTNLDKNLIPSDTPCFWESAKEWSFDRLSPSKTKVTALIPLNGFDHEDREVLDDKDYQPILEKCYPTQDISWEEILWGVTSKIQREPETYRDSKNVDAIRLAYGLLQAGNSPVITESDALNYPFRKETLRAIYASDELQERVYAWAMPFIQERFKELPEEDQKGYLEIADHTATYLATFSYQEELDYYEGLASKRCPGLQYREESAPDCTGYFTQYGPGSDWKRTERARTQKDEKGNINWDAVPDGEKYRKAEAWVFRRVNNGEMTPGELRSWVGRIRRDLKEAIE